MQELIGVYRVLLRGHSSFDLGINARPKFRGAQRTILHAMHHVIIESFPDLAVHVFEIFSLHETINYSSSDRLSQHHTDNKALPERIGLDLSRRRGTYFAKRVRDAPCAECWWILSLKYVNSQRTPQPWAAIIFVSNVEERYRNLKSISVIKIALSLGIKQ